MRRQKEIEFLFKSDKQFEIEQKVQVELIF